MTRTMVELTTNQCKQVAGGSGYITGGSRSGDTTTTTTTTDRSGYITGGSRSDTTTTSTTTARGGYISSSG